MNIIKNTHHFVWIENRIELYNIYMSNNNNHQLGEAPWLHVIISTGFGTGFFPWGPGTFGGFIALLIWIALYFVLSPVALAVATVVLVVATFFVGVWTDM